MSSGKQVTLSFRNVGKLCSDRKIVEFQFAPKFAEPSEYRYHEVSQSGPRMSSLKEKVSLNGDAIEESDGHRTLTAEDFGTLVEILKSQNDPIAKEADEERRQRRRERRREKKLKMKEEEKPNEYQEQTRLHTPYSLSPSSSTASYGVVSPSEKKSQRSQGSKSPVIESPTSKRSNRSVELAPFGSSSGHVLTAKPATNAPLSRTPNQNNLGAVMDQAYARHAAQVQKELKEEEEENKKQLEHFHTQMESERIKKQERLERDKMYRETLKVQMEQKKAVQEIEDKPHVERTSMFQTIYHDARSIPSSPMPISPDRSPKNSVLVETNAAEKFPPIIDNNRERILDERRRKLELRSQLDQQIHERSKYNQLAKQAQLEDEWKTIEKANEEFDQEKTVLQQKKREMGEEMRTAWLNQLYLKKEVMSHSNSMRTSPNNSNRSSPLKSLSPVRSETEEQKSWRTALW
jgi:hypothetical protein